MKIYFFLLVVCFLILASLSLGIKASSHFRKYNFASPPLSWHDYDDTKLLKNDALQQVFWPQLVSLGLGQHRKDGQMRKNRDFNPKYFGESLDRTKEFYPETINHVEKHNWPDYTYSVSQKPYLLNKIRTNLVPKQVNHYHAKSGPKFFEHRLPNLLKKWIKILLLVDGSKPEPNKEKEKTNYVVQDSDVLLDSGNFNLNNLMKDKSLLHTYGHHHKPVGKLHPVKEHKFSNDHQDHQSDHNPQNLQRGRRAIADVDADMCHDYNLIACGGELEEKFKNLSKTQRDDKHKCNLRNEFLDCIAKQRKMSQCSQPVPLKDPSIITSIRAKIQKYLASSTYDCLTLSVTTCKPMGTNECASAE